MAFTGRAVLLTGVRSGIGAVFARRFAERGAAPVLAAGRERELTAPAPAPASGPADLAESGAGTRPAREVAERGLAVDTLVNDAGAGSVTGFADAEPSCVTAEIQLSAVSLVELTTTSCPGSPVRDTAPCSTSPA
ncbi:SDR family NAD(P)-dependent oxidoreductase [Streptomyces sp. TRM 70361]|nr:SDR family NAD(P)-dependent oxidoreductase [Streptomyces sp. TRM 70361]MEE1940484.1 SDR family NAD(P)-dependent oxidoreductase [Streptomyces sp. TRM 70361]